MEAIRSMQAVGVQLHEGNVHDLRTNYTEVWEKLRDVLKERGWGLSVLDFASLA